MFSFPDNEVRRLAVKRIRLLSNDQLIDFLPELVQAIKHETYDNSPLAEFLLEKALSSPTIAHNLYWFLIQPLPGQSPQVCFKWTLYSCSMYISSKIVFKCITNLNFK